MVPLVVLIGRTSCSHFVLLSIGALVTALSAIIAVTIIVLNVKLLADLAVG